MSIGLSFFNEYRSEKAVEALHSQIRHLAFVERDGQPVEVNVTEIVPGDVVHLRVGDVVPADLRLLAAHELECDESVLTGESQLSAKTAEARPLGDSPLDLPSCAFMGTLVRGGDGRGVVVRTGAHTAFGAIAAAAGRAAGTDRLPARAAGLLSSARDRHRCARGLDLRDQRRLGSFRPAVGAVRARDRRRPDSAAAARDRDRQPGDRRPPPGTPAGDRQAPGLHRGPRQRPGAVHGQDRHAHRGSHLVHRAARLSRRAGRRAWARSVSRAATRRATSSTGRSGPPPDPRSGTAAPGRPSTSCRSTTSGSSPRPSSTRPTGAG